ncbi:MAG: hypothetical protein HQK54_04580 [Oligoflexales bacterium]|nr:hypothetical protein [Oligoflexales bacterium]
MRSMICLFMSLFLISITSCGTDSGSKKKKPSRKGTQTGQSVTTDKNPISKNEADSTLKKPVIFKIKTMILGSSASLALSDAENFLIRLEGCSSGNKGEATGQNPYLYIYQNDQGCLAKLINFSSGAITWTSSASNPFSTYQDGETAIFVNEQNSTSSMQVTVISQIKYPLTDSSEISYSYKGLSKGEDVKAGKMEIGKSKKVKTSGQNAPSYKISTLTFKGTSSAGAGIFVFDMECTATITQNGSEYYCSGDAISAIHYRLVEDTYNSSPDYSALKSICSTTDPGVDVSKEIKQSSQTFKGGFFTKELLGPNQMYSHPNMLLILDIGCESFQYFNIDLTM